MKRSKLLLVSGIIGTLYGIYIIYYFLNATSSSTGAEQIGAGLATALVMPHMAFVWLALIFNWLGYFLKLRWAALVAGILYAVAMLAFFIYFMFVIVEMILCFVAFAKMEKKHEEAI